MSKLLFGLEVTVLGMGIVFTALAILSYLTSLLAKVAGETRETAALKTEQTGEEIKQEKILDKQDEEITPELVAVITAAVHESLGTTKYRITDIREISKDRPSFWSQAGRMEQMNSILN